MDSFPANSTRPIIINNVTMPDTRIGALYIVDGVFVATPPSDALLIDGSGLIALPGLVDPHTHLREPGGEAAETIATGTLAAARGGYTCVLAMPNTTPTTNGAVEADWLLRRAAATASAAVLPIGAVTLDRAGQQLADIASLATSQARVRVFSDDGACVLDENLLRAAMQAVLPYDAVIAEHAQDTRLAGADTCCGAELAVCTAWELPPWPREAEWRIVERDIQLAAETGARLHICHVSTTESLELIRSAKAHGVRVTAEATPHHLLLDSECIATLDTAYKVSPPLRPVSDVLALRRAVIDGTIDMIATDHAPHTLTDKACSFPNAAPGMIGLEYALGVVMEVLVNPGLIGWSDVARLMSYAPAALAGLTNQGQPLTIGAPANLTLINPIRRALVERTTAVSKGRNNPYHGRELPDPVECTIWAGKLTNYR
ncbi:MAG: dihydroorotase [Propionibacteriaceae bacterium]|jgi:dihydroorotase|nr:dihydroorotase [Propionibacteriaceae bacterium]